MSDSCELIITQSAWRAGVMPLLAAPTRMTVGVVRREHRPEAPVLLCDALAPLTGALPDRRHEFVVIAAPGREGSLELTDWLPRLEPSYEHLLALLLIGLGPDRAGWKGWTVERSEILPLAGLKIIGSGMVEALTEESAATDDDEPDRWSRLRGALGSGTFAKVRRSHVAVVGTSRTGTLAALQLAALGVGRLTLIDGDRLEPHNLDGAVLATPADVGQFKSIVLGNRLCDYRPDLAVTIAKQPINERRSQAALAGASLIVTGVDQDGARLIAASLARQRLIPHLDIGAGVTQSADGRLLAADVRMLLPGIQLWLDLLAGDLPTSAWHRLRWRPGRGLECVAALVDAALDCPLCRIRAAG